MWIKRSEKFNGLDSREENASSGCVQRLDVTMAIDFEGEEVIIGL